MHVRSVKKSSTFVVICTVELAQIDDFWEIYYEHEFFFFSDQFMQNFVGSPCLA